MRAGVYNESNLRFSHSGEPNAPITLSAYPKDSGFETVVIDGSGAVEGTDGILIDSGRSYIVLKRLEIRNMPNAGIATEESARHRGIVIENVVVNGNSVGIWLSKTDEFELASVTACDNIEEGIRLINANNGSITSSQACRNQVGFNLIASSNNRLENNRAHDNGVLGFAIYVESQKNILKANTSYRNRFHGFVFLAGARDNTVAENKSYDNCRCGFYFESASNNDFRDNQAYDNGFDGFTLFLGSGGNHFQNNTAERNSGWGFLSDFDSPNDSLATGNTALTNGAGAFGEIAFDTVDFAAYTDISNPWDCH